ncbi:amidohydrolase family protein [Paraburkholderia sediminicola]
MSCTCGAVDIHTHFVPENFPAYVGSHADAPWPSTAAANSCHRHVMVRGSIYRTVSEQSWSVGRRISDMHMQRTAHQVLSPMPELLGYWLDVDDGAALCRFLNETVAEMVGQAPGQFSGLAAVPLQDVDCAIRELEFASTVLGLKGAELGTNVNGKPLGHPDFLPFFQAAAKLGASIFVHPLRPAGAERLIGPPMLEQVLGFPGETGLCAASIITGNVLEKAPGLRIAFSHGGGSLASLLPRLQHGWNTFQPLREFCVEPRASARRMFYDMLVYDDATINRLIDVFGLNQLMVGSDYPFSIMDADANQRVHRLSISDDQKHGLIAGNALSWLGVSNAAQLKERVGG